jgi:hypothetical protein
MVLSVYCCVNAIVRHILTFLAISAM